MNDNEKHLRMHIGKRIKLARCKAKYTQERLAEHLSLSAEYISQLERGIAFGSATTITNLCKALNINSDFLFDELISDNKSSFDEFIDEKFLETFVQLNDYNKEVISTFTSELLKLQQKDNITN